MEYSFPRNRTVNFLARIEPILIFSFLLLALMLFHLASSLPEFEVFDIGLISSGQAQSWVKEKSKLLGFSRPHL